MMIVCGWYLIPLVRWVLRCAGRWSVSGRTFVVLGLLGRVEWAWHMVRDTIGLCYFAGIGLLASSDIARHWWHGGALTDPQLGMSRALIQISALVAVLSSVVWWDERRRHLQLLELASREPRVHPDDFFCWYFASHGPVPLDTPVAARTITGDAFDTRTSVVSRARRWPIVHALASTYFLSTLVLLAARSRPPQQARAIISGVMALWSARVVQLWRAAIRVEGGAHLAAAQGPIVICANHVSAFDFVVLPVALALAASQASRPLHVRFLAARDHFLDNWFLRRGLRMGEAMAAADMIFVHRTGTPAERAQSVTDAVERMTQRGIDVIVFPQGTRAPARPADAVDAPAGYCTAGGSRRAATPGAHCRPGAARMAIDAARIAGSATLLPVALIGTDRVLPSRGLRIRTQQNVTIRFGVPIVIDSAAADPTVLTQKIDHALRDTLHFDAQLLHWAAAHGHAVDPAMFSAHPHRATLGAALDIILQLPAESRPALLSRWQRTVHDASADIDALYRDVVAAWE